MIFFSQYISLLELAAIIASLGYVILNARLSRVSWWAGALGAALYCIVFFQIALYGSAFLSCIFLFFMVYGWSSWKTSGTASALQVRWLSLGEKGLAIFLGAAFSLAVYHASLRWMYEPLPVGDAAITGFSIVAQFLAARKKIDAWYWWLGINLLAVYTYATHGIYATAALYGVYAVLAVYGLLEWRKEQTMHHTAQKG